MNPRTVYKVLEETAAAYPSAPAMHQPVQTGKYRTYNWLEYRDAVREIAVGLRHLGVEKGDVVALHAETRAEFYLADIGIMAAGAIAAALYTSLPVAELLPTLRASEAHFVFVENPDDIKVLEAGIRNESLNLQWILLTGDAPGVLTLDKLRQLGRDAMTQNPQLFDQMCAEFTDEDYAILYMTSGATGQPKMALVTHRAIVSNIDMAPAVLPIYPDDSTIVFLPSAHIAQRVVLEMVPLRMGTPVWFSESLSKLGAEMRAIRPTFLLVPPRVWERVYASITTEIRKRPAITRRLFYTAIGVGSEASRLRQQNKPIPAWMRTALKFFDRVVFSKIRQRLGGRLRIAASGAAPLAKDLAGFYASIGMPLIEGYGLTEGGVVALNPLDRPKSGSIGKALPGVEIRLDEDGELLVRGPCLFSGYFKDPDATAAVLRDGWLATGDIAEIDADGYLYITGRKKELIVSSNGKKIYPAKIENLFKCEPLINQVLLIGDRMPYVTALFTVNIPLAETLKGMESLRGRAPARIVAAPPVLKAIGQTVKAVNKQLASFEQIRKFRILERDFSIEYGEVTPTMKVRRNRVLENHRGLVSELYMGKELD